MCVYTIFAHNQIIHDIFCRNFAVSATVQVAVCQWIMVHSYLLMRISQRKSSASVWEKIYFLTQRAQPTFANAKVIKFSHTASFKQHFLWISSDFSCFKYYGCRNGTDIWTAICQRTFFMQIYFEKDVHTNFLYKACRFANKIPSDANMAIMKSLVWTDTIFVWMNGYFSQINLWFVCEP